MNIIRNRFIVAFILFSVCNSFLHAQTIEETRGGLYKLMMAFPSKFQTLKGRPASATDPNVFFSTIEIPGTDYCVVKKDNSTGSWEWEGTITSSDDEEEDDMEKTFKEWRKKLTELDINGAKLKPYASGKYTTENKDKFYEEGYAWRLDNSRNNIDPKYRNFTVRLECMRFEDDFLVVRLLISDR